MSEVFDYPGSYIKICTVKEISEKNALLFRVNNHEVLIINVKGQIKAYYGRCAHNFNPLPPSSFDGEAKIICPIHLWVYNALTGKSIDPQGYSLFPLDVKIEEDNVLVKVPSIPVYEFRFKWFNKYTQGS